MNFMKNIWTVRHTFIKLYGDDPEIIMSDQMPLNPNESSELKTLNFKGVSQSTYVKENHSLSHERITVKTASSPNLEFVFKGVGKRVKLNALSNVSVQWAPNPVDTRTKNVRTKDVHKRTFISGSIWKHGKTSHSERLMNVPMWYA